MSTLSRIITVVLLVLGVIALWLGLKLFGQREEIKGRTQKLEKGIIDIVANIEGETATNLVDSMPTIKVAADELKRYYYLDPTTGRKLTTGSNTLDGLLVSLVGKSAVQHNRLKDLRDTLKLTRDDLEKNRQKLKETETALDDCGKKKKEQEESIAGLNKDIDTKKQENSELKEEKDRMETKLDEQNNQLMKLKETKQDLETKIEADKRFIDKLQKDLADCQAGGKVGQPAPGLQGQIMAVNSEWNFVVVDIPPESKLLANVDLIVQREDKLVGKVRVTEVRPAQHYAIADVLSDWQQTPVKTGDFVFF
jgi:myosin heavy subunit